MNEQESMIRIGLLMAKARTKCNVTQEEMAKALNRSRKTVSRWEAGFTSPTISDTFQWFDYLGENSAAYLAEYLFPESSKELSESSEQKLEEDLVKSISLLSRQEKEILLYLISGKHGSSRYGVIQLIDAHLHTSLRSRVSAAITVMENYDMEQASGSLVNENIVPPDLDNLRESIMLGKQAFKNGDAGYSRS